MNPETLTFRAYGSTDVGKERKHNEDALLIDPQLQLFMVCDGMGGHLAGEVASVASTAAMQNLLKARRSELDALRAQSGPLPRAAIQTIMEQCIEQTCSRVWELAQQNRARRGMGSTLDALLLTRDGAVLGHVGDSRVYLVREGRANRLTEDHSMVAAQLKAGMITRDMAEHSSWRGVLTRAIGTQAGVEVDVLYIDVQPGDRFLLCSDGLYKYVTDDELGRVTQGDLAMVPARFVALANERGGSDNITAVVLAVGESEDSEVTAPRIDAGSMLRALSRSPLFAALSYKEQTAVLALGTVVNYGEGQQIVYEDEPGSDLFLVLKGRVNITKGEIVIRDLSAGGHFGEMSLVQDLPRSASAVAKEASLVLRIGRDPMMSLLRRDPGLAVKLLWNFVQTLSDRLRGLSVDLVEARQELGQVHGHKPFINSDE